MLHMGSPRPIGGKDANRLASVNLESPRVIEGNEFVFLENIEDPSEEKAVGTRINFSSLSEDELKTKLIDALADEAYEKAAKIRDELSRRKSS